MIPRDRDAGARPEKLCEITGCTNTILSRHRTDEGGHLCAPHFYALAVVEGRGEPLDLPEGPRRRHFITAVTIISHVQRLDLLAWREKNPRGGK